MNEINLQCKNYFKILVKCTAISMEIKVKFLINHKKNINDFIYYSSFSNEHKR